MDIIYQLLITGVIFLIFLLSGIKVKNRRTWWIDTQILFFTFTVVIYIINAHVVLSLTSYVLMTVFVILHIVGARFSYIEIPFGYTLGKIFHTQRNIFDRLVHFSFGLLFTYPFYEVFFKNIGLDGFLVYYLPFSQILAISALFEIFEWLRSSVLDPELAEQFVGMQGDIWDSSKYRAIAGAGSLVAIAVIFALNIL